MRSGVIMSIASRSATCDVTRNVLNSLITFISPKKPLWPVSSANIWCSSWNFQPPRCSAPLLSGAKEMPSSLPASARSIIALSVSPVSRPDSARARAALELRRIDIAEVDQRHVAPRKAHLVDALISRLRNSHACIAHAELQHARIADDDKRASVLKTPEASTFAAISGPMPVTSPSISPRVGSVFMLFRK